MSRASISFPMLGDWSICPSPTYSVFGLTLHWYGAIMAAALIIAAFYVMRISKRFGIKQDDIVDTLLLAMPMTVIGCRLYYVVFNYELYRDDFWGIFRIWEGGLAMYGGLLMAILSIYLMCRRKKTSFLAFCDMAFLGVMLGQVLGRWGNFINREAYGFETEIFCRMGLTLGDSTIYVHPLFLYEMIWNAIGLALLHPFIKKRKYDGQIALLSVLWYGIIRVINDGIRQESLYLFNTDIPASQFFGGLTALVALVLLIVFARRKHSPEKLWVNRVNAQAEAKPAPENGGEGNT